MANNPKQPDAATETKSDASAETDARIAELEKKLEEANARNSVVENLQAQLLALQAQITSMVATRDSEAQDAATREELQSEAEVLQSVINDERVIIRIASGEGDAEKKPVPVIVNGHMVFIPRDIDAEVPNCAYQALLSATETKWETDDKGRPGKAYEVPRFNVVYLRPAEKAEE